MSRTSRSPASYAAFTKWANKRILERLNREAFGLTLERPDLADSLENKQLRMQLVAGGELSRETGYKDLVDDPIGEISKRNKEDLKREEITAKAQQEFQQKIMKWMMIFFGLLFYKVAAGLCIYFIVSSAWGLLERRMLPKKGQTPSGGGGGGGDGPAKPGGPGPSGRARQKPPKKKGPEGKVQKVKNWWQDVLDKAKKK